MNSQLFDNIILYNILMIAHMLLYMRYILWYSHDRLFVLWINELYNKAYRDSPEVH